MVADSEDPGTFAAELERYRRGRNLTPAGLARSIGASTSQVSRWRRGGGISIEQLQKVADWMGRSRGELEPLAGYPASRASNATPAPDTNDPRLGILKAAWSGLDEQDKYVIQKIAMGSMTDPPAPEGGTARPPAQRARRSFTGRDLAHLLQHVASPDPGFAGDIERIRAGWRAAPHRQTAW